MIVSTVKIPPAAPASNPISKRISMVEVTGPGQRPQLVLTFENVDEMRDASDFIRRGLSHETSEQCTHYSGKHQLRCAWCGKYPTTDDALAAKNAQETLVEVSALTAFVMRQPWFDPITMVSRSSIQVVMERLSAEETSKKPARDAEHCDFPDCEQHNSYLLKLAVDAMEHEHSGFGTRYQAGCPQCEALRVIRGAEETLARPKITGEAALCGNPVMAGTERYTTCKLLADHADECSPVKASPPLCPAGERCLVAGCTNPALVSADGALGALCEEHNGKIGLRD